MHRHARWLALAVLLVLGACGPGQEAADPTGPTTAASEPSPTPPASEPSPTPPIQDIAELEGFAPLEPGAYFIDPDSDPSTPLGVEYEVPVEGWSQWAGAVRGTEDGHVIVSITTVVNLCDARMPRPFVRRSTGRTDRRRPRCRAGGPGPVPGELAAGGRHRVRLPREVPGTHRARPAGHRERLHRMRRRATSGVGSRPRHVAGAGDAFYGYTGPGYREEFWILDVEGTRLVIVAGRSPASPSEDLTEQRAILDSIQIEP